MKSKYASKEDYLATNRRIALERYHRIRKEKIASGELIPKKRYASPEEAYEAAKKKTKERQLRIKNSGKCVVCEKPRGKKGTSWHCRPCADYMSYVGRVKRNELRLQKNNSL